MSAVGEGATAPTTNPVRLISRIKREVGGLHLVQLGAGLMCLLALVLRLHRLAEPALRWDEGWSLAHASLGWGDLIHIAALDTHPPLYMALLKLWLGSAGESAFALRYLSVLLSVLAVPLAYAVARAWSRQPWLALFAALYAAMAPLLVYYGQVARMYPLATLAVLAATYLALREPAPSSNWARAVALALAVAVALYSLYYTIWPLAAILLYAALTQRRQRGWLIAVGAGAALLYLPWLIMAGSTIMARTASGGRGAGLVAGLNEYLSPTLQGLFFTYATPAWTAGLVVAVLAAGLVARPPQRAEAMRLLLPAFVVVLGVVGLVYGASATQWFAPRHLAPVSPFFGLALAWSLHALGRAWRPLPLLALGLLAVAYWSTGTQYVYAKTLEVVDPFDPAADHRFLAAHARPGDIVFFNVLSTAGWYENLRQPGDPPWSYALRWEPVIQPVEEAARERILPAAAAHRRLWFVLYQGTQEGNAALKEWLDTHLYPAGGEWGGDTLYLLYAAPDTPLVTAPVQSQFGDQMQLVAAEYTPEASSGGVAAVTLRWRAPKPVSVAYKVFVHLADDAGRIVAQHDAQPVNDLRPTTTWGPDEIIVDRHGLSLPETAPGTYHLEVGLYNPETGERLHTADGRDALEIGTVAVASPVDATP